MAMKKTLLQIVQNILSDMDSEDVNSISDTVEATQIASIVENTFYNIIATRNVPEHEELLKITALADNTYPTHFQYPENLKTLNKLWYQNSSGVYTEIKYCEPLEFIKRVDAPQDNYDTVYDKNGGTSLRIINNKHPQYYSSFDDDYVILDSYESSVEATLQESKIRGHGTVYPVFSISDSYVPDLDAVYFPYLINESKAMAQDLLKGGATAKTEQAARRQKSYIQNDRQRSKGANTRNNYGR